MLEEKILNEEIKVYKVGSVYIIYGKTFNVKDEVEKTGAKRNLENKKLEITLNNFNKSSFFFGLFYIKYLIYKLIKNIEI